MNEINTHRKNLPRTTSRRHKVVVSVLITVALGIAISALAWAQDSGKHRRHGPWGAAGGPDMSRFMVRMLDRKVGLDDAQTAAIEQIIAASGAEGRALRAELAGMRKEIAATIQANGFAEDQVRIAVESHSTQMIDLMMLRIRTMAEIYAQLTPEQQASIKDFMDKFGGPGSGPGPRSHRHRHGSDPSTNSPAASPSAPPADNL